MGECTILKLTLNREHKQIEVDDEDSEIYNDPVTRLPFRERSKKGEMAVQHIEGYLVDDKGTWTVRARFADTPGGRRKLHSKSTGLRIKGNKRRAEEAMRDIVSEWERQVNAVCIVDNPLFEDCIDQWLERKKLTLRPNTIDGYRVAANAHVIPELGQIKIADLTRQDIQRYFERLQRDGISVSTMKKHRVIIHGALNDAVLDGLLTVNVADNISLPKSKKFEGKALSETQVADMLVKLEKQPEPVRAAVTLAVIYGLRRSEICGLRWEDIDFENSTIHIRNTVTEYSGTVYEVEDTKTKTSRRDLYLVPDVADYLKSLLQTQKENGIFSGKVCVHLDGREVKPSYCTSACERFVKACGYDGIRLHDLRATAASILASKGVPIKQVQTYLGHKDVQTTLSYYVHVLDADRIATANVMGNVFASVCSEGCSEKDAPAMDNVIPFESIMPEKLAEK